MTMFNWFVIGFLVLAMAERAYERRYSHEAVRGRRKMEWSFTVFHSLHVLIYMGAGVENLVLARPACWAATGVGLLLFLVGTIVRLSAIRTLGRFWSLHLEIREGHELVTGGIYEHVRHPAYSGIMLEVAAIPLVAGAYWTLLVSLGLYIPLLLVRWRREEAEMMAKFGEQYERYRRCVPAFVPWRFGRGTTGEESR
jgi:protein-S-isoprenylcysteine O-methyltransferase Ste14